ncbi:MAG: hybrid sensor histidine kinase/response regulator transcription factor [Bacteroidota bacterium]
MRHLWIYCLLIGGGIPPLSAQMDPDHPGLPAIQTFSKAEDPLLGQIWAMTQDQWGNIYAGCNHGIVYYNGYVWRNLKVGNYTSCLSMDISVRDSTIYVGGENEIGFLVADSLGQRRYRSLLNHLPEAYRLFGKIWDVYATKEGIFFRSPTHLFLWESEKFRVWEHPQGFDRSFWDGKHLWIQIRNQGLMRLEQGALTPVPGSEWLQGKRLRSLLFREGRADVYITRQHGLYLWEEGMMPILSQSVTQNPATQLYRAIQDRAGRIFLGTVGEGIIQLTDSLQYVGHWNENIGLSNSTVYQFLFDSDQNLWIGTKQGCNVIQFGASHRYLRHRDGLPDNMSLLCHHHGTTYLGGNTGLYAMNQKGSFSKIPMPLPNIYGIESHVSGLLIGSEAGLSLMDGKHWNQLDEKEIRFMDVQGSLLVTGAHSHLRFWRIHQNQWELVGELELRPSEIPKNVYVREEQEVWVNTAESIIRLIIPDEDIATDSWQESVQLFRYEGEDLPQRGSFRLFNNQKGVFLYSSVHTAGQETPLYYFDPVSQAFQPDSLFAEYMPPHIFRPNYEDSEGNIWGETYNSGTNTFDLSFLPADPVQPAVLFGQLNGNLGYFLKGIYSDTTSQLAWALGSQGMTIFDQSKFHVSPRKKHVQIEEVVLADTTSTILFGGFYPSDWRSPEIPYPVGRIRLQYSLLDFELPDLQFFQYQLKGLEKTWSPWTPKREVEYTSLSEGDYIFKLRALDGYGQITEMDSFAFTILPPWYRTWWARLLYLLAGILLLWGWMRIRNKQLRRKNENLEQLISLRTEELAQANLQLRELDQMKSRFFANISHEFRTPLSLIIGPLEQWMEAETNKRLISRDQLMRMHRNAGNLLRLVNQLLDLARLDARQMPLHPTRTELVAFFRGIAANFSSLAEKKQIVYQIISPNDETWVEVDREKYQTILVNLLSNACKFCPDHGEITVELTVKEGISEENILAHMRIADSGMGIPEDRKDQVFDRFFQLKGTAHHGSGIGLALTRELTELMGGTILVENRDGAVFYVEIPCSKSSHVQIDASSPELEDVSLGQGDKAETMSLLLVEDHTDIRAFLREQLVPEYTLLEAQSGEEGVKLALTYLPDLIISDLMMPGISGLEMSRQLKQDERTSHIPIILLTAKAEVEDRIAGFEEGADAYLVKPFHMKELRARISNLLLQREQLRRRFATELTIQPTDITVSSADAIFLEKAIQIVEEGMAEEGFGVNELRDLLGLSRTQFHRKLKALTDQSPSEFIRALRLKRAAQLLEAQADTVSQIAFLVGFNNLSYFAKCFKELFGVVPSEYPPKG